MVLVEMEGAPSWFVVSFLLQVMQKDLGKIPRGAIPHRLCYYQYCCFIRCSTSKLSEHITLSLALAA